MFFIEDDSFYWFTTDNPYYYRRETWNRWSRRYGIDSSEYKNIPLLREKMYNVWMEHFKNNPDFLEDYIFYHGGEIDVNKTYI